MHPAIRWWASISPHIAIGALEAICEYDRHLQERLQGVKAPKITINARPTNLVALQRSGIVVMQIHGVGHFVMMEDVQRFNRLLDEALQNLVCLKR